MPGVFYADYFLPNLVRIEEHIPAIPTDWIDKYESFDELYQDLRSSRFGWDKVAIGDKASNIEVLSDLISDFLEHSGINPDRISYICDTDVRSFNEGSQYNITYYVQNKFGLKNACVFSLEQTCGASCFAMGLASSLVAQKGDYAVILSSNTKGWSDRLGWGQIMGDAEGILVISKESTEYEVVDFASKSWGVGSYTNYSKDGKHYSEDPGGFAATIHIRSVKFIQSFLGKNGLTPNDINAIITQTVNRVTYYDAYAKPLGISGDRFYLKGMPNGGHLGNVDMARNFKDLVTEESLPDKAYILFYAGAFNPAGDITNNLVLLQRNKDYKSAL